MIDYGWIVAGALAVVLVAVFWRGTKKADSVPEPVPVPVVPPVLETKAPHVDPPEALSSVSGQVTFTPDTSMKQQDAPISFAPVPIPVPSLSKPKRRVSMKRALKRRKKK